MLKAHQSADTNSALDAQVIQLDSQRPPAFTDESLALKFAEQHSRDLRFVATQSKWYAWTGSRWEQEDTLLAYDMVRAICRQTANDCDDRRVAKGLASSNTVSGVERLAKSDRRLAGLIGQFDLDPMLLNTPGGVVDLKSGRTRPHRPEDYLTRITAVAPGGEC